MTGEPGQDAGAVHPAAPPSDLAQEALRVRPDRADGVGLAVDPGRAGWRYLSFRAVPLRDGATLEIGRPGHETALVVVAGGGALVETEGGAAMDLRGRASAFDGMPWAAYLPVGTRGRVTARAATPDAAVVLAIAEAPGSGRATASRSPIRITPTDVATEVRGAGNATRQVNHIITPDFPADRLLVVEVYTPGGNWSSWPPHKHDVDDMPREAVLEEVYYYQLRRPEGWAIQRLYRRDGSRDGLWAVRHGEVVLVTDGYHPFAAAHGYDAYYLNALAGDRRTMACSDDPDLGWTRASWLKMEPDPRMPVVRDEGDG